MERVADDNLDVLTDQVWNINGVPVEVRASLSPQDRDTLWNMVQTGFMELNAQSYEKQDMTNDEFTADLDSQKVYKYITRDKEGQPTGLLMVHEGLEGITWADMSEQKQLQAETGLEATSYYVGTMVVSIDKRATRTAYALMKGSFLDFKRRNDAQGTGGLVFFDCAEANYPGLPNLVKKACRPSQDFSGIDAEVRELYIETTLPDEGESVYIVKEQPGSENEAAIDRQHYYVVML